MTNENENLGGERRDEEIDRSASPNEAAKQSQQPEQGQQGWTGGQQGQQDELGSQGGGFVGSQDQDSGDYLQEGGTGQPGFAEQGRGALDEEESGDIEQGGERSQDRSSDIEGSSENE